MVTQQSFITVTDKAAERAKAILTKCGVADAALRVFVVSGGCSGYQFGMTSPATARPMTSRWSTTASPPGRPQERADARRRRGRLRR